MTTLVDDEHCKHSWNINYERLLNIPIILRMIISWFYCLRFARPMRLLYSTGRYNRRKSAMDLATIHDLGSKRRKNVVADQIMRVSDVEIDSIVSLSL